MKEYLEKFIASKKEKLSQTRKKVESSNDVNEVRALGETLEALKNEIEDAEKQLKEIDDEPSSGNDSQQSESEDSASEGQRSFKPLSSFTQRSAKNSQTTNAECDVTDSVEYRTSFMNFAKNGTIDENLRNVSNSMVQRADSITMASDVVAVTPNTLMTRIIEKLEKRGIVWQRITKLNLQGGVSYPIAGLKPVATRIKEGTHSEKQKYSAKDKIQFSYYGLECKVAQSILAAAVTLQQFEDKFVEAVAQAMITRIEIEVFNGTGEDECLGITQDNRIPAENIITMSEADIHKYTKWCEVFAAIPLAYEDSGSWYMSKHTYETIFKGMVDETGQPISRFDHMADKKTRNVDGYEATLVETDTIPSFKTAKDNDVFMAFVDLSEYAVNSNLQLTVVKYTDHDLNQVIDKAIMICDGKLLDPNGVVLVKKAPTV